MLSYGLVESHGGTFDDHALQSCPGLHGAGSPRPGAAAPAPLPGRSGDGNLASWSARLRRCPHARTAPRPLRAAEAAREIAELCLSLHSALVHARIADMEAP